jgi:hypothetical protein
VAFSYNPYPADVQALIGTLLGAAVREGWHGRARVSLEGPPESPTYVITIRVKTRRAAPAETDRELKRRARIERG